MQLDIKNKKYILFLLAFLGLVVSIELTYIYFKANFLPGASPSFCTINEVIDCDTVAKTIYSTFFGIPQSVWGIMFYSFIMFLSLFPFNKFDFFRNFKNPESYIFTISSFAVLFSLNLWVILSFIIHKVCLLCYVLYIVNILLLIFSGLGKPIPERYKDSFQDFANIISDTRWLFIVFSSFVIMVTMLIIINITGVFMPKIIGEIPKKPLPEKNIYSQPIGNTLGSKNAKFVIREYTDFQCPYCAMSTYMLVRLVKEEPDIRVEHHDFPLNKACNPIVQGNAHKYSCQAAYYSRAAKMQGKYWDYILLLFDNQKELNDQKFIELAKELDLNIEKFKKDATSEEVKQAVMKDIEMAKSFDIKGTPTYIMGIKKHEGIMTYPELKRTVEENL